LLIPKPPRDGLTTMFNLRGGIDSVRTTKPGLYATISWYYTLFPVATLIASVDYMLRLDMVAACNLYSKRRFSRPKPPDASLKQAPEEKVPETEPRLPPGYDMTQVLPDLFKRLGIVTSVIKGDNATDEERLDSSTFISEMDAKLFGLRCLPDRTGNTSRRHHLNQVFPVVVLIYVTFISGHESQSADNFFSRFEDMIDDEAEAWGRSITKIFKLLLAGVAFESELFAAEMSSLIEACINMDWEAMRDVKVALFEFFVKDPACKGQLQDLWKNRIT
jgi:hypothetical protein